MEERKPDFSTRVPRQELLDAVSFAGKFSYRSIPVLENAKLTVKKNGDVLMQATDLETNVVSTIESEYHDGGEIELLINKKKLADTLKTLKDESVMLEFFVGKEIPDACPECGATEFDVAEENTGVLTPSPVVEATEAKNWDEKTCSKCGHTAKVSEFFPANIPTEIRIGGFFTLIAGPDVGEYPDSGEFPKELVETINTTAGDLRRVIGAAGNDELSYVKFSEEDNLAVATDGHRMHMVKMQVEKDLMLPAKMIGKLTAGKKDDAEVIISLPPDEPAIETDGLKKTELVAMWEKHNGEKLPTSMTVAEIKEKIVSNAHSPKRVYMVDGNKKITMNQPAVLAFPDYRAVLNREGHQEISVNTGVISEGMKQALALVHTEKVAVRISFNGSIDLETVVEDASYNRTSVAIVSGGVEPPVSHNYNAKYISNILDLFKKDVELTLSVPEGNTPLFFNDNEGFEALVMPTRVS